MAWSSKGGSVTSPRIVYIHGAGPQEHRAILKRRLDELLFGGNQGERSIMAYYSDILNVEPEIPSRTTCPLRAMTWMCACCSRST